MSVRVRYAPSPTGLQHIGGIRTALFNYFFARSSGGSFILRIEDTDRERYHDEALEDLFETLRWLGIEWDEGPKKGGDYGPYIQSERHELYQEYTKKLIESGHAYYCFCSSERLETLRQEQQKNKASRVGYDGHCRSIPFEEAKQRIAAGEHPVVRFKVPAEGKTSFDDVLLGTVTRKNRDIPPDPVILKSDGFPTYHLANVVDDHLMKITHILRAQEWIPSGALHVLLYRAFGWEPPVYCHLPMVMGKDGQKLSKRHGATAVREFRKAGYLPEALINYVSLIGWSYDGEREFFTKEELEKLFSLEKINKAPGVFDYRKLEWFNGQYIRRMNDTKLVERMLPFLEKAGLVSDPPEASQVELVKQMVPLVKERMKFIPDAGEICRFAFEEPSGYTAEELIAKKMDAASTIIAMEAGRTIIEAMKRADDDAVEEMFREKSEELGFKLGQMLSPLRVAITGSTVSPPLFGSIRLIGIDKALDRIDRGIELLKK
ncbi:glutamate--tRNA ligase [Sediminispirochaeta bajacaliforniensis]|uniref:glutamate--tRNA ligase n=1 Tax=Sediminispirochaeta bajacaliforniensis TaxID=148 RepID=UPI000361AD32|nr:glutamate--tRNA ligase [Sediminispirochaeta bajacaliforniensis]